MNKLWLLVVVFLMGCVDATEPPKCSKEQRPAVREDAQWCLESTDKHREFCFQKAIREHCGP